MNNDKVRDTKLAIQSVDPIDRAYYDGYLSEDDLNIVIDCKEYSCTKRDKVYVELDNSVERSDVDCTELKKLVESFNIPRDPISCTMHIKKKSPNYKRVCKFLKKLYRECSQNESG